MHQTSLCQKYLLIANYCCYLGKMTKNKLVFSVQEQIGIQ